MKNKITAALMAALCLWLAACTQTIPPPNGTNVPEVSAVEDAPESDKSRTITDLGGNVVEIPAVSKIERVVVISPPLMSFVVEAIPDTEMIAGINGRSFTTSNKTIVDKVFSNWKSVDTTFIDASFAVNTESLLKLSPDIIFYYGNVQKEGLGNIGIPSVDFFSKDLSGPEDFSVAWDVLLREIFGLDQSAGQKQEWKRTNEAVSALLQQKTETKSALCIASNIAGSIVVSGQDSFDSSAQSFFDISGIRNVAEELNGTVEVSMEQIYQWNPDIIFVFRDAPASSILSNTIDGQDWSRLNAWKNKAIYDIPRTTYSWVTPCADCSLLPMWLVSKAYPQLVSEDEVREEVSQFYQRRYDIILSEGDLNSILLHREPAKP